MSTIIAWLVALCGASILIYVKFLKFRTARESRLAIAVDTFYEKIAPLISDVEVPAEAIDLIAYLNRQMTNRSIARRLFFALLRRRAKKKGDGAALRLNDVMSYYLNDRKELAEFFLGACVAAVFAMSYQSQIFGGLLRRLVFFDLNRHEDRAPDIVASLQENDIGNGEHCAAPA
jgi:hypothetical protein